MLSKCVASIARRGIAANSVRIVSASAQRNYASAAPSNGAPSSQSSFARGLFLGKLREEQVFPFPATNVLPQEAAEELKMLVEPCSKFFREVNNPALNDENAEIPEGTLQGLREMGAFGLQVPQDLGGLGLTNTGYARLVEVVGAHDLAVGIALGAHQSIGFKGILIAGNDAQKKKYLPKLASGEQFAAFALTEPSSGSDANSIRTRAVLSADGKHFVLNGSKIWISNGGIAEIFTVFAQTEVVDAKTGKKGDKVTAFIVERSFGGVTNGAPEKKMGIKCSNTAEVYFEDVKVPIENVIGDVGGGFKVAMNILNNGRFGMGAALTGTMKALIAKAADHANGRVQFGHKIREYGLIREKFAKMALRAYATESIAYTLSANMDRGSDDYQIEAAISKVYASESAWFVADEAIQILGGMGFMKHTGLERVMRDIRIFRIFEGTNEILRLFIALTGIQSAATSLRQLQKALASPLSNLGVIMDEAPKRLRRTLGVSGGGDVLRGVHPDLRSSASLIESRTADFGAAIESLLSKHGKDVINQQMPLRRVAEVVIDLYAMAAVTSRATHALNSKLPTAAHEALLCKTYCEDADERLASNIRALVSSKTCDQQFSQIAGDVLDKGEYIPTHPLGF
eukprot:Opistho-2@91181